MVRQGLLERPSRGLYRLPAAEVSENHTLAELAKRVPRAVICLLTALRFHELTTQSPHEVWLAIGGKQRPPRIRDRKVRIVRFSGPAMEHGIQEYMIEGVKVRVYGPAKTVADCFKFRAKIGQGVAIEALRDCLHGRKATPAELWEAAKVCRVASVMRPYLEALL
jgi:predicted transcriptional regulator of viral defense system